MSAKVKKLEQCLSDLINDSEVEGCALVSERGQLMVAQLRQGIDEKAISAMAAALLSIGNRVGEALGSGEPKNIVIEGKERTVVVKNVGQAVIIAAAPADAKIGLVDFEMEKAAKIIESIL